jgi:hypothetical protein
VLIGQRNALRRGSLVSEVLAGSWRPSPPTPALATDAIASIAPLLARTGVGALAWWTLRGSAVATSPVAVALRQTYRLQTLQARLAERRLVRALDMLRSVGIEPVLAKGWAAARLYPQCGLRPYGDIDLWVAPHQHARAAAALRKPDGQRCRVDLHEAFGYLRRRWCDAYDASRVEYVGGIEVRVMSEEDHLALLCGHMLAHGAWRPVWLCDIAAAAEQLSATFDWARCLAADVHRGHGVACSLGLARELLGADTNAEVAKRPPRWLAHAVLRQWGRDQHYMSTPSMAFAIRHPRALVTAIRLRWPNAVQATAELEAPFNDAPRLPFQIAHCVWRARRGVAAWQAAPCAK